MSHLSVPIGTPQPPGLTKLYATRLVAALVATQVAPTCRALLGWGIVEFGTQADRWRWSTSGNAHRAEARLAAERGQQAAFVRLPGLDVGPGGAG